jgi:hypothetical protein
MVHSGSVGQAHYRLFGQTGGAGQATVVTESERQLA